MVPFIKMNRLFIFLHPRSLTASLPLKIDGWKTFSFPFGKINFQGRAVKL